MKDLLHVALLDLDKRVHAIEKTSVRNALTNDDYITFERALHFTYNRITKEIDIILNKIRGILPPFNQRILFTDIELSLIISAVNGYSAYNKEGGYTGNDGTSYLAEKINRLRQLPANVAPVDVEPKEPSKRRLVPSELEAIAKILQSAHSDHYHLSDDCIYFFISQIENKKIINL